MGEASVYEIKWTCTIFRQIRGWRKGNNVVYSSSLWRQESPSADSSCAQQISVYSYWQRQASVYRLIEWLRMLTMQRSLYWCSCSWFHGRNHVTCTTQWLWPVRCGAQSRPRVHFDAHEMHLGSAPQTWIWAGGALRSEWKGRGGKEWAEIKE